MEQPTVVTVGRWSLYGGALVQLVWPATTIPLQSKSTWDGHSRLDCSTTEVDNEPAKCGLYRQVVLYASGL